MSKNKSLCAVLLAVGAAFVAVAPAQATPFQWSVTIGAPIAIYPSAGHRPACPGGGPAGLPRSGIPTTHALGP